MLLAITDGELPADIASDHDIPPWWVPIVTAIARHRNLLGACQRPDTSIDLLLAVAPGTSPQTLALALLNAQRAGVERHFYAVAGGSGRRTTLPNHFTDEEVRIILRRADGLHTKIDGEPDERPSAPTSPTSSPPSPAGRSAAPPSTPTPRPKTSSSANWTRSSASARAS